MRPSGSVETYTKLFLVLVLAVAVLGPGCERTEPEPVSIVLTNPQGAAVSFEGRFGKHEQWETVTGTTPDTFDFDLSDWPPCYCLHRLILRKTTPGDDTLRVRGLCHGEVVSDTLTVTGDSLDYPPFGGI
jgi:hypothetical protein